ncbi:MAG: T9SS type A sorting domain-containing protein [Ignavibacteriaceae bacterium]|nr:T9SS type A sorting domain-containing protein [Ignavibacteriaceae bacterium]
MKNNYISSFFSSLILGLFLLTTPLNAQPDITFHVDDLRAGPPNCNWMFENDDDPHAITHDGNYYTPGPDLQYSNYAYRAFTWATDTTSSSCTTENTVTLAGTGGVTLKLYGFTLKAFRHTNTVNPNGNWNVWGQAGDERIYADGIGEVYVNDVLKLKVINCRLSVTTPYPTEAQLDAIYNLGNIFTHDAGAGTAVTGGGWGVIDLANSDAALAAELDPNGTGQLEYELSTISTVLQGTYGYFDFNIKIKPTVFRHNLGFRIVQIPVPRPGAFLEGTEGATTVDIPESDVSFNFTAAVKGDGDMNTVLANQIETAPGGVLPGGIEKIANQFYWQLGTTLKSFTADVTFDITDIPGVTSTDDLRILKRNNSSADWAVWGDITVVDPTHLRANGVTSFGEFAIGSVANNPLPVELVSFTAQTLGSAVILNWSTATEINNNGFQVQRQIGKIKSEEETVWENIGFVTGSGNSNSTKQYSFTDNLALTVSSTLSYRLKQIDNNGDYKYSNVIEATAQIIPDEFALYQNYPNPFNPSTRIKYTIPNEVKSQWSMVSLKVYDVLGNEVATLVNEQKSPGNYEVDFNSTSIGRQISSGIYFYKIQAGKFTAVNKMILTK